MPENPRRALFLPYPDPDTLRILQHYRRLTGVFDYAHAAEHLIAYGAKAWLRLHRAGKRSAGRLTPEQRQERARRMARARWERERAKRAAASAPTAGTDRDKS